MRILLRWAIGVVAILATVKIMHILPKPYQLDWPSLWGEVIFVPLLPVVNAVIGTILRLMSMPITCITFGLFGFIINALVFWIAGYATGAKTGEGATISFLASLFGSIIYTVISIPLSAAIVDN